MATTPKNRPKRTPLGARNRLSFQIDQKDKEAFSYRVINDQDDRLARAQEAGYEFVQSEESLGDLRVAEASSLGANVAKPVGNGVTGYLMRIKKEWYDEDQAAKEAKLKELEQSMQSTNVTKQYGEGLTDK
jgi:hypothetical protein